MKGRWIKKLFLTFALLTLLVCGGVGAAGYYLTRPLSVEFAQAPNVVEAEEANRKLKLLSQAQSSRKQGFVRFNEVEINSFLDGKYHGAATNAPVRLLKAGLMLGEGNLTFVTWHQANVYGLDLPFVWQRVIAPQRTTNGWSFTVQSMKVGDVEIPEGHWPTVEKVLGATDSLFAERKEWLKSLPLVTLASNEESKTPEVRLYTYLPEEKSKVNETVTE